jgi:RNA polymerase sigma-70 factor (ECF subfamily)
MKPNDEAMARTTTTLVAAARDGDEAAARMLYERHVGRIRALVARSVGSREPDVVDDICQETWIRAFRGLRTFRGEARFSTWLHAIARREVISWYRSRERSLPAPSPGVMEWADHDAGEAVHPEPVPLRIDLERAMERLPPGMRRVLWLHDVEGLTHVQVGRRLRISPGTSKSQLHHARTRLREELRPSRATAGMEAAA